MKGIYFDHAATSFPKPPGVAEAVQLFFEEVGASPGRGGYRSALDAGRELLFCRHDIAKLFNCPDPSHVVFTLNVTYAINFVLEGILRSGDHVITSSMEHNAVARPLEAMRSSGRITYTMVPVDGEGVVDPDAVQKAITPHTRLIVLNHASNVFGSLQPAEAIGEIAKNHGVLFLLDTAQTAGSLPIDMQACHVNFLAFTGHKGLLGPPGVGGLCIQCPEDTEFLPTIRGGTGSQSHLLTQPALLPDRFESGTPNTPGIMGLRAGVQYLHKTGIQAINQHELLLTRHFLEGCREIRGITLYGPSAAVGRCPCVSLNAKEMDGGELSFLLEQDYQIMTRSGLHCAPWAHQSLGTFPEGTVRFSFGWANTKEDVEQALAALRALTR